MNTKLFKHICKMGQNKLHIYAANWLNSNGYKNVVSDKKFVFAKGELPVMLVAHLDTVHKEPPRTFVEENGRISSPQGIGGDDRCGVYMIMDIVKELKCSVLFCRDEEIGGKGAEAFCQSDIWKDLKLNYIIEFDRRGDKDAVFYDCANDDFTDFIMKESGEYFTEAWGTFSDISFIAPSLKIAAVNLSCGYYKAHTTDEYVVYDEMEKSIEAAKKIIKVETDKPFEYIENHYYRSKYDAPYGYGYGWDEWDYDDDDLDYYRKVYTILYEDNKLQYREKEIVAVSEDEAVGMFLKENPWMTYSDIVNIYIDDIDEKDNSILKL